MGLMDSGTSSSPLLSSCVPQLEVNLEGFPHGRPIGVGCGVHLERERGAKAYRQPSADIRRLCCSVFAETDYETGLCFSQHIAAHDNARSRVLQSYVTIL